MLPVRDEPPLTLMWKFRNVMVMVRNSAPSPEVAFNLGNQLRTTTALYGHFPTVTTMPPGASQEPRISANMSHARVRTGGVEMVD